MIVRLARSCSAWSLAAVLLLGGCATTRTYAPAYASTAPSTAAGYFWDDLSPYGQWIQTSSYGWVWSPYDTYAGWRPYTYGRWAYSDYGWTWVSYWDWGNVPFHYGRWTYGDYGWVWVPGTTWGPAWVAWRQGPSVVGWAPLPPSAVYVPGYGVRFGRGGLDVAIGSSWWVFTDPYYLTSPRIYTHTYLGYRNPSVFRSTRAFVGYEDSRHGVIHRGVDVGAVERRSGRAVPRLRDDVVNRTRALASEGIERSERSERLERRQRVERPARPLERPPVRRGERDPLGTVQRQQRPEDRPPRRDPLRRPAPMPRPDDQIRPRRDRPMPPFVERRSLGTGDTRQPRVERERPSARRERPDRPRPTRERMRPPRRD